jgi:hypothetical protein
MGRRTARGVGRGVPLINYATLPFTRSSEAAAVDPRMGDRFFDLTSPWRANDVPRIYSDGAILIEGPRTNALKQSRDPSHADWAVAVTGAPVVTPGFAAGPDGLTAAARIQLDAAEITRGQTYANVSRVLTAYVKRTSGASQYAINTGDGAAASLVGAAGVDWVRVEKISNPGTDVIHAGDATLTGAAPPNDYLFDLAQVEESQLFPSSPIRTTTAAATSAIDRAPVPDARVPGIMRTGRWAIDIWPRFSSSEIVLNELHCIVGWGATMQAGGLYLYNNGGSIVAALLRDAGSVSGSKAATWSRHQKLTLTVDVPGAQIILAGFSSGNGSAGLVTPGTVCEGSITIGSPKDLGLPAAFRAGFAVISQPRPA